jgi:hypothetical protein
VHTAVFLFGGLKDLKVKKYSIAIGDRAPYDLWASALTALLAEQMHVYFAFARWLHVLVQNIF